MNDISFCKNQDVIDVQNFIDQNWKKNHILFKNRQLFDFQHKDRNQYNFVISRNKNQKINGVLGFISNYQFDTDLNNNSCIWLALWKVDESTSDPGLGISLLRWLEEQMKPKFIGTVGLNLEVKPLYELLGYTTGILNHYYYPNSKVKQYKIAKNIKHKPESISSHNSLDIKKINLNDIPDNIFINLPLKSKTYVKNRFLNHPSYQYLFFGVFIGDKMKISFVARKVEANGSYCLRIVDMFGDFSLIKSNPLDLQNLVDRHECEYIDCLNFGIPKEYFIDWGFHKKADNVIIPEYFEPFIQNNNNIRFAYKSESLNYTVFKADGDQDRPNILKK